MLVLLPPSETKAEGGRSGPVDLAALAFPELHDARTRVIDEVRTMSAEPASARALIGVPASKDADVARNTEILHAKTLPAIQRYTGVLYDALDHSRMTKVQRDKANRRLAIGSAAFGLVRAGDEIPFYRLSASSSLPSGTVPSFWREAFTVLTARVDDFVVDLRSGGYAAFGTFPGALTVRVMTENASGGRTVVSHFSKHTKGLLARALVLTRADPSDARGVIRVARAAGLRAERTGETSIDILT